VQDHDARAGTPDFEAMQREAVFREMRQRRSTSRRRGSRAGPKLL